MLMRLYMMVTMKILMMMMRRILDDTDADEDNDDDDDEDENGKDDDDVPLESGFQEALEFQIESRVQEAAALPDLHM